MLNTKHMFNNQRYVHFGDDYSLSIVDEQKPGTFELAVLYKEKLVHMPGISDPNDTVTRFRTQKDVEMIMKKMVSITGKIPQKG